MPRKAVRDRNKMTDSGQVHIIGTKHTRNFFCFSKSIFSRYRAIKIPVAKIEAATLIWKNRIRGGNSHTQHADVRKYIKLRERKYPF